jgi:type I restriction enzyme S subunit
LEVTPELERRAARPVPEGWGLVSLGACIRPDAPICYGILMPGSHCAGGVPVVKVRDIVDGRVDESDLLLTHPSVDDAYKRSRLAANDVLVTIRGTTGRVALVSSSLNGANITQDTARLRIKDGIDARFLYFTLQAEPLQHQIAVHTIGQAVKGINIRDVRALVIELPDALVEQRAIATALSDVDALLEGLTRLIAKKRDLKQAAMQQLLTGQTRLPGFRGEWEVKRLGDHVTFLRNGVNSRAELTEEGPVKYVHYGDVHACKGTMLFPDALPSLPSLKASSLDRLEDGDLILADASEDLAGVSKSVEIRGVGTGEVVSGLHTIAARFEKDVLADGFKAYLQFCPPFAGHLRRLAAGTKVYATNRAHVASVEMPLPAVDEQTAIAAVLSDMDAELSALEARREKTRVLKQAMMQELLTGRTRLV